MAAQLQWDEDAADWPNREASRFVEAAGFTWHVQKAGDGPPLLLLHGTGASTHSVAALAQRLARYFTVVAPDLPGHAFTGKARRDDVSLPGMARSLAALLDVLAIRPAIVVGHSAGAAVLLRMALDRVIEPKCIVSINGALLPLAGLAGRIFSPLAKVIAQSTLVAHLLARRGSNSAAVGRVLRGTGSTLDARQIELYRRLFASPLHVASTLDMMAQWDLVALERDLPRLTVPLVLIAASDDEAVPPDTAFEVVRRTTAARVVYMRGAGHLAHEERPDEVADLILQSARTCGAIDVASVAD